VRRRKRVLILGCGPAGLFAAQAALLSGADYQILSKNRKSELFGAQYLQMPIAGLADESERFTVSFELHGTFADYKRKVYGDQLPDPDAVPEDGFFVDKPAWDIRAAYDRAWSVHSERIEHFELSPERLDDRIKAYKPTLTISTVPLPVICREPARHAFSEQSLWAIGDAPERGILVPFKPVKDNTVIYDGTDEKGWHRCAKIQGYGTIEWPEGTRPPVSDVAQITKPVATSCNCYAGRDFIKAGRYGAWSWAGQSHHSYLLTEVVLR
jgi:hypothetical protein